jgi:hypothetical protein
MPPVPRERWQAQAAATMTAIADWREAIPGRRGPNWRPSMASWPLRTQVLTDAQASAMATTAGSRPPCPRCGGVLHDAGTHPSACAPRARPDGRAEADLPALPGLWRRAFPPWIRNWRCSPGS